MADARLTNYLRAVTAGVKWLGVAGGRALSGAWWALMDSVIADSSAALSASRIAECSADALDPHARNTLDRRTLIEGSEALRAYLLDRWSAHSEAGAEAGLLRQLARCGYPECELWSWQRLKFAGVPNAVAFGGNVGFFFVIIRLPHWFRITGGEWDGGGSWGDGSSTWGGLRRADGGDVQDALAEIAYVLHRWRPSGRSPRFIVIDYDGTTEVVTTAPYGFTGNYDIFPVHEDHEYFAGPPADVFNTNFV